MLLQYGDELAFLGIYLVFMLVALAVQIGVIVWVVKDAKSRGIDPTLWGLLTCFFGWIGCLIYLVTREGNTVKDQQPVYGAPAPQPGYGAPAPAPGYGAPAPAPGYSGSSGRACQNCGAGVDPSAKFCPKCGSGNIN